MAAPSKMTVVMLLDLLFNGGGLPNGAVLVYYMAAVLACAAYNASTMHTYWNRLLLACLFMMIIMPSLSRRTRTVLPRITLEHENRGFNDTMGSFLKEYCGSQPCAYDDYPRPLNCSITKHGAENGFPKLLHVVWIGKEMAHYHYISVHSFIAQQNNFHPVLHTFGDVGGEWYNKIFKQHTRAQECRWAPFNTIFGRKCDVLAHKSDVLRLFALLWLGGVYQDLDVITLRPYHDLFTHEVAMGREAEQAVCNAVIIARPNAMFIRLWLSKYVTFEDDVWSYHSVRLPYILYDTKFKNTTSYRLLNQSVFYHVPWQNFSALFKANSTAENTGTCDSYAVHLWAGGKKVVAALNFSEIVNQNTVFGQVARYVLQDGKHGSPERVRICANKTLFAVEHAVI